MWIYNLWQVVANIFISLYIYKINNNFFDIVIYNGIFFTAIMLWFVGFWFFATLKSLSIRLFYQIWYILFALAFMQLLFFDNIVWIYIFSVLYGLWMWLYWNAVHTQELAYVDKKQRNYYSSFVSIWKNLIESLFPLIIAVIFYVSNYYNFDWYYILFLMLIWVYFYAFLFTKNIKNYSPNKINVSDLKHFCNLKKHKFWNLYYINGWLVLLLRFMVIPIITIYYLKNEVNIWLFQALLAIISSFVIVHISYRREKSDNFKYYAFFTVLIALNYFLLNFYLSFIGFVVFSLLLLLLIPLHRVSEHIYDLETMDNVKHENNDFYPTMLFREILLWLWRILGFMYVVSIFLLFQDNIELVIRMLLISFSIFFLLQILFIYLWRKYEKAK